MQVVKKGLLYLLVILFSLAIFAPKRELYYLLEEYLMRSDIIIDGEKIHSGLLALDLEHPVLYVKGIKVAKIGEVSFFTLLFYTKVSAKDIEPDASFRRWIPGKIDEVVLRHQVFDPLHIHLQIRGEFGTASGIISLKERKVHIDVTEQKSLGSLRSMLKKGTKGWYYESSF
jgi:hypothetical protein